MKLTSHKFLGGVLLCLCSLLPGIASAGGIILAGTRVVYPMEKTQKSISIRNSDKTRSFLVQSWVEDAEGKRTKDFIVTPPLYVGKPGRENTLRLVAVGGTQIKNKETLYYFNVKAIPSLSKKVMEENSGNLMITTTTRVKMFARPAGLRIAREKAPDELQFIRKGKKLEVRNPTPYYLTLVSIKYAGKTLGDIMVAPESSQFLALPANNDRNITWNSIDDFGAEVPGQANIQ